MPRKARIDAAGALHHIIIRGIERKAIFRRDKENSISVLRRLVSQWREGRLWRERRNWTN